MRKNVKLLLIGFAMSLFIGETTQANTNTQGENHDGLKVHEVFKVHQNKYNDFATDLHFKLWQKEDNIDINGWDINISNFTNSSSQRGNQPPDHSKGTSVENHPSHPEVKDPDSGQHAIDVTADGAKINYCTWVTIDASFWLVETTTRKGAFNTKRLDGVNWTKTADPVPQKKAVADFGWVIEYPVPDASNPGQYLHEFVLTNDDPSLSIWITGLQLLGSNVDYSDLDMVTYSQPPITDFLLNPGESFNYNVTTIGTGGYIYAQFNIRDDIGGTPSPDIVAIDQLQHPVPEPSAMLQICIGLICITGFKKRFKHFINL